MPRVVIDTSVSLPATLSPAGMARKFWVLLAYRAINHQIGQHRTALELLRSEAETIGADPKGLQRAATEAGVAEQRRAILRDLLPDNAPEHWVANHGSSTSSGSYRASVTGERSAGKTIRKSGRVVSSAPTALPIF